MNSQRVPCDSWRSSLSTQLTHFTLSAKSPLLCSATRPLHSTIPSPALDRAFECSSQETDGDEVPDIGGRDGRLDGVCRCGVGPWSPGRLPRRPLLGRGSSSESKGACGQGAVPQ